MTACNRWSIDADEGVTHETRTLRLCDIPYAGKILKAVGLEEMSIKAPVLIFTNVTAISFS